MRTTLAALFAGVCIALALPAGFLVVPALFALAPLLVLARQLSRRRRFMAGWLAGAVCELWLFGWVAGTLEAMTDLPGWGNLLAALIYAAWHGLRFGLFLMLAEPARRAADRALPGGGAVAIAAVWVILEWLWPSVFFWALGHAFWQVGPVNAIAALGGVEALSFVVVGVNAVLAAAWVERSGRGQWTMVSLLVALLAFGTGWWMHVRAQPPRRVLRVAILQPNHTLEERANETAEIRERQLDRLDGLIRSVPRGEFDLILGPESGFPYFWRTDVAEFAHLDDTSAPIFVDRTRQVQRAIREGPRTHAILGGLREPEGSRFRNAAVHFAPDGGVLGVYDKRILVPFGEYVPGRDWFPELEHAVSGISSFDPGETDCRFVVEGELMGCGICYESVVSDHVREGMGDASVHLNLTNDSWFGESIAPHFHLVDQSTRAVELGVPLIRSALTGISAVILADGTLAAQMGLGKRGYLDAKVPLVDVTPPYRVIGPVFRWVLLAIAIMALWGAWRERRRQRKSGQPSEST